MSQTLEYTALSDQALIDLLFTEADRLPRAAADEIIRRGVPLAPALVRILDDEELWTTDSSRWWAIVHATYLLAAMQPPGALETLIRTLERADRHDVDWITNDARHLLSAFGPTAVPLLRSAALDGKLAPYVRVYIVKKILLRRLLAQGEGRFFATSVIHG